MAASAPLRRRPAFLRLWAAQAVSGVGARIAREGLPMTAVLLLQAPPAAMGALAAVGLGAYAVDGVIAGPLADRLPGRPLLIGADLGRAAVILTIRALAPLHALTLAEVGVALALDGNAKLAATDALAEVGGPAIAGGLLQLFSAPR
jgi:hypothetical protein